MKSEMLRHALATILGGGLGSLVRFGVGAWTLHHYPNLRIPWATLGVNWAGCLLVGLIYGWVPDRWFLGFHLRYFIITGFLGGFTTFSAFGIETALLFRKGDDLLAWVYIGASVAGGLLLAWAGMRISTLFSS
jgi:CrcB protein